MLLIALCAYVIVFFYAIVFSLLIGGVDYGRDSGISLILIGIAGYYCVYQFLGFWVLYLVFLGLTLAIGTLAIRGGKRKRPTERTIMCTLPLILLFVGVAAFGSIVVFAVTIIAIPSFAIIIPTLVIYIMTRHQEQNQHTKQHIKLISREPL